MVRYGIGVPPALKQFAYETFEKAGRGGQVERTLTETRFTPTPRMAQPRQFPPIRSPQMSGPQESPPGTYMARHGHPSSAPSQMAGPYQPPS